MRGLPTRVRQVIAYSRSSTEPYPVPEPLRPLLRGLAKERFDALDSTDQRHLVDVASQLAEREMPHDVVTAGLLHDIGKSIPGVRITVLDRILKVVLPDPLLERLAGRSPVPRFLAGIVALQRHAESGAEVAQASGYPERVVWLIRHHERRDIADPDLQILIAIDDASAGGVTR